MVQLTGCIYHIICASCRQPKAPYLTRVPPENWICGWCVQAKQGTLRRGVARRGKIKVVPAKSLMTKVRFRKKSGDV